MSSNYKLYCCGSRGSRPVEGIKFNEFGGFTSCYVLKKDDYALIIDCGTGLYEANSIIVDCPKVDVVITHMHYDHVLGMLDWDSMYQDRELTFYGGFDKWFGKDTFKEFFRSPFWPVQPNLKLVNTPPAGERLKLRTDLSVEFFDSPHPNDSQRMIIRVEDEDKEEHRIAIMFDNENAEGIDTELLNDCDYLIYDGMYTDEEYPTKKGYGHSTWQEGVRVATRVDCKHLIVTHHSPFRTDEQLRSFEEKARVVFPNTDFARSGQQWDFPNNENKIRPTIEKEESNFLRVIKNAFNLINKNITDEEQSSRTLGMGILAILGILSLLMSLVNYATGYVSLMYITLCFSLLCGTGLLVEVYFRSWHKYVQSIFQIICILMFTLFIIFGEPEGFSLVWLFMLPIAGTLAFGIKRTIILSAIIEFILVFFFYTDLGRSYLRYPYSKSTLLRMPVAFLAFFCVGLFLSFFREKLRKELIKERENQAKTIATQTAELRSAYFEILQVNAQLKMRNEVLQKTIGEDVSDNKLREYMNKDNKQNKRKKK